MKQKFLQQVSAWILATSLVATLVLPASTAVAQVATVPVNDFQGNLNQKSANSKLDVISEGINGQKGGVVGGISSAVESSITKVKKTLETSCLTILNQAASAGASSFLQSLNASNVGLIGGSDAEAVMNSSQAAALKASFNCIDGYVKKLANTTTSNLQDATELQREQNTFAGIRDTLEERVDAMNARASASWKDVLKAFMVKTILNINKTLTTELVNKMVDKYKISDYSAYGDALATQVYSMKYISENYAGDARQQMMIRSLMQSEKFPEKIKNVQAIATAQAQEYIGQACDLKNPNADTQSQMYFINCLGALGSPQADKNYHISKATDQTGAAVDAGKKAAAQEISQSNGFAPPRNCSGSLAQQQQVDGQVDKATAELKLEKDILARLTDPAERAKAQAKVDQAQANFDAVFQQLQSAGGSIGENGKSKGGAIIDICEGITSPSSFVANGINDFLKKHLDQASDLKSDNLPFYASFLSDVTSNFLTNILTGGKSTSQVLKEAGTGALNGALIGVLQTGAQGQGTTGTPANPTGEVEIYVRPAPDITARLTTLVTGQTYVIGINFKDLIATSSNNKDPVFNPYRVEVSGVPGLGNIFLVEGDLIAGKLEYDYPAPATAANIRVQFYAKGTAQTGPGDVPLNTSGGWTKSFAVTGAVKGDTTFVPSTSAVMPRGPQVTFR